jgi:aryl-alcohol dehydrogenase-like predicted oxidoreductase
VSADFARRSPATITIGAALVVKRLGYGAMQLTGRGVWGEYPDRDGAIALLRRVVETGVTFIDTADAYGPHTNEMLIHDALWPYPEDLVIATKGGFIRGGPGPGHYGAVGNREYLRQSAFLSARRLGVERIDLYYLHTPNATDVPFEEQVETLAELRAEGLIRHIGLSNVSAEQFQTASAIVEIAAVTAHFNVSGRTGSALLSAAESAGVAFSPWHPTSLSDPGTNATHLADALGPIADRHGVTLAQLAIAWLLHRTPWMLPIPGTSSIAHFEENLAAADIELSDDEVNAMTALVPEIA